MKVSFWKILVAGILFAIVGQVIHSLGAFLGMRYYTDPTYFKVWSKLMMPAEGPPPTSFYIYSILFSIISGILIALVYAWIREGIKGKRALSKGLFYGFILFLIAGIPGFLSTYMLINIPMMLNVMWLVEGLIVYLIGGIIIAALIK